MENLAPPIRNAPRAVILQQQQILLLRKDGGERGERYALPGGAQEAGETLAAALDRECREEIGTGVLILGLLHVGDWFKRRDTEPPSTRHLVEFLFHCEVPPDYLPRNGHHPDKHQIEVLWLPLATLHQRRLLPAAMAAVLQGIGQHQRPVYLGTLS